MPAGIFFQTAKLGNKSEDHIFIIDEISMMSDNDKNRIFELYPDMKIIMCGDNGFQLPCFEEGSIPFKEEGFDNIRRFNYNRRCKCEKLRKLLNYCRKNIKDKNLFYKIQKNCIGDDILKLKYKKEYLNNHEKYYVLKTDRKYCKGEILFEKPDNLIDGDDYEKRHAFTIHSIQGETAKHNLYIGNTYIEPTGIYTALSRAEYLSNIYWVN